MKSEPKMTEVKVRTRTITLCKRLSIRVTKCHSEYSVVSIHVIVLKVTRLSCDLLIVRCTNHLYSIQTFALSIFCVTGGKSYLTKVAIGTRPMYEVLLLPLRQMIAIQPCCSYLNRINIHKATKHSHVATYSTMGVFSGA